MMTEREFYDGCRRELASRRGVRVETLAEKAARLDAMQPPGPALLLHMAAARLRPAAVAAIARQAEDGRSPADWARDMGNYLGGPIGEFCALMTPQLALDLCDWLDATAAEDVRQARAGGTEHGITGGFPDAAARSILGEAS